MVKKQYLAYLYAAFHHNKKREVSDNITSLQMLMKTITAVHLPKVGTQGRKEPAVTGHHSTSRVEVHIFGADEQEKNH
jgi:hypothetical protein